MATGGGEMPEREMVPFTGARGIVGRIAAAAFVHAAVTLILFLLLEEQTAQHYWCQCMEACSVLSIVEGFATGIVLLEHAILTVCSVVQLLAAALALLSTGWLRRAAAFVALATIVATGMQPFRLVYAALFGTQCCFSGGIGQVAFAVALAVGYLATAFFCGGMSYVVLLPAPLP